MGGVRDHINHFDNHIKGICLLKAWGAALLKGPGGNTVLRSEHVEFFSIFTSYMSWANVYSTNLLSHVNDYIELHNVMYGDHYCMGGD